MITVFDKEGKPVELDGVDASERVVAGLAFETQEQALAAKKPVRRVPKKEPDKEPEKHPDKDPDKEPLDDAAEQIAKAKADPVVKAIATLDRDDAKLWTQKGKGRPTVKAVEKALGKDITEAERDHAWDLYLDMVAAIDGG